MKSNVPAGCIVLLLTIASSLFAVSQTVKPSGAQILRVGEFHQDEVTARSGEPWLGLFRTPSGYELRNAVVSVSRVHDPIVDEDTTQKTGWKVSVETPAEPILLLRGIEGLMQGTINGSFSGMSNLLPDQPMDFRLEGRSYSLAAEASTEHTDGGVLFNGYILRLSSGGISQRLFSHGQLSEDGMPRALWAGDLDRDGKVDLLLDLTSHYNVTHYALFLSGAASSGDLVRLVAAFVTTGC